MTGDALLDFVDNQLFATLKSLSADPVRNPRGYVVRGVFEDAYNYMKSGHLLRQVVNKLNAIDFNRQAERHQFNDLYEKSSKTCKAPATRASSTPRAVTQFMVDMVNPQLGEVVLDPATGTGGFLVCAIEHLRKQVHNAEQEAVLQTAFAASRKSRCRTCCASPTCCCTASKCPATSATTTPGPPAARLHRRRPRGRGADQPALWRHWKNRASNKATPPTCAPKKPLTCFGAHPAHPQNQRPRRLVLPDGFLFGEGVKSRIKEQLLQQCNLHTIVRLPNGVFAPYTGIKTNLLFFTKGQPTQHVWYYEHPYPPGVKNYNKTKPIRIEEFDAEKAWWGSEQDGFAARVENERAWKVSIDQIKAANWNLDQKNPMWASKPATTPRCCWPTTPACRPRPRPAR